MDFGWYRLALTLVFFTSILGGTGYAQFKKIYLPDTLVLEIPNVFNAAKVLETDVPGKELAIIGSFNSMDSGGNYRSEMYNMLLSLDGEPQAMNLLEDTSVFSFAAPHAYSACYDGNGIFYFGTGANSQQVIVKTDIAGQLLWARAAHHHEYYSLVCEGGSVTFLGQDESVQGAHDFSLARLDAAGTGAQGTMFGTPEFELPQKMAKFDNQFIMVGGSFQTGGFVGMMVKANAAFEQIWGRLILFPGKNVYFNSIDRPLDGHGYIMSGRLRGGADSLFIMKTDTAGTPIWTKVYGITGATEVYNSALAIDPETGGYLLAGNYRGAQYARPMIFMTDSVGNVQWARDYGDPGVETDETLNDIIYCQADSMFCAVGDRVEVAGGLFLHKVHMIKVSADSGTIPCDSALSIGVANASPQLGTNTVEEPFLATVPFPIGNMFSASFLVSTRCEVITPVASQVPRTGIFQLVNPSGPTLQLQAEVPMNGALLRVTTLTGEVVLQQDLEEGFQQMRIPMTQLSSGMYLVSMAGEEWRYPTLRWVVQR